MLLIKRHLTLKVEDKLPLIFFLVLSNKVELWIISLASSLLILKEESTSYKVLKMGRCRSITIKLLEKLLIQSN